jgi:hypothetical protein
MEEYQVLQSLINQHKFCNTNFFGFVVKSHVNFEEFILFLTFYETYFSGFLNKDVAITIAAKFDI